MCASPEMTQSVRRNMNELDRKVLIASLTKEKDGRTIVPNVPDFAIHNLEDVCTRTGLDWRQRHCYLIERGGKWRVELSIDGFRAVAAAHPEYDGQDGPYYTMGPDDKWTDVPPDRAPYAAKVGIRRKGQSQPTYATAKFSDYQTGAMWKKFPTTMTAKCAEMLALRKAFPGQLGGLYGAEEMDQAGGSKAKEAEPRKKTPLSQSNPQQTENTASSAVDSRTANADPCVDFCNRIEECTTLEKLKDVGAEIQASSLGLETKMQLNKVYQAKKGALSGT